MRDSTSSAPAAPLRRPDGTVPAPCWRHPHLPPPLWPAGTVHAGQGGDRADRRHRPAPTSVGRRRR